MSNKKRLSAICMAAVMCVNTVLPAMPAFAAETEGPQADSESASTKEVLSCGYEIDMGNLPKVYFADHPEWEEIYDATWEIHKNNIAKIPAAVNPEEPYYVDEAFSGNIFVWDTMLMMMFDKYGIHEFPTLSSIDNFYYNQTDSNDEKDGYICREIIESSGEDYWDYNTKKNTGTNPPLFAMAEWEQYQIHGDVSRFSKVINGKTIFERLVAHYNYIERNKKMANGLYGKTNGFGNGLDNTPNQDGYVLSTDDKDGKQTYNDLSIQQAQAAWYIALIAEEMGKTEEAEFFKSEHARISALINEVLWSEEAQMYSNIAEDGVTKTNVSTPTNLWALAGHVATEERAEAIIDNHGLNSQKLYRPKGLATTAYDWQNDVSRFHAEGAYWLGSVWAPTSYQYVYGLREYGYDQLAFEEAVRHVNMASDVYKAGLEKDGVSQATVWENYSSEYNRNGSSSRANFAGWTGSFGVGMVLEDLIGVDINAPDNIVTWNVQLTEAFGVDNLYMSHNGVENRVSLHAEERISDLSDLQFTATVTAPVTLVVKAGGNTETFQLEAGTHSYVVEGTASEDVLSGYVGSVGYEVSEMTDQISKEYYEENAVDYVYFTDEVNEAIDDGIVYQAGKNNGTLYNINTVGVPANQGSITLKESTTLAELGFENAQSVEKGAFYDDGFMFMAPASNKMQTMRLVVGVENGTAELHVALNDASAARQVYAYSAGSEEKEYVIDIPYIAASDDTSILVQWLIDGNNSSSNVKVSVKSVALFEGGIYVPSAPSDVSIEAADNTLIVDAVEPKGETYDFWKISVYDALSGECIKEESADAMPFTVTNLSEYGKYYVKVSGVKDDITGSARMSETVLVEPSDITDADRAAKDLEMTLASIYNGNTGKKAVYYFNPNVKGVLYGSTFTLESSTDGHLYGVMNDGALVRPAEAYGDVYAELVITAAYGDGTAQHKEVVKVPYLTKESGYVLMDNFVSFKNQTVNLTEEGTIDWVQIRENITPNSTGAQAQKKGADAITSIYRNIDAVPSGEQGMCTDAPIKYAYDANDVEDETPINSYGSHMRGEGNYLKFNLPYSEKSQHVNIYVGTWNGLGEVQFLVNGHVVQSGTYGNKDMGVYKVGFDYLLENETDTAEVRLVLKSMTSYGNDNGSVFLHAVTLSEKEVEFAQPEAKTTAKISYESVSGKTINLTEEGTLDWFQLPQDSETNYARKAGGEGISGFRRDHLAVPNGEKGCVTDGPIYYTATDADPNYPAIKNRYGMQMRGIGNAMEFNVGYGDTARTVKVYTGSWYGQARVSLIVNGETICSEEVGSDKSAMSVFATTIQYKLGSPDDVAKVRVELLKNGGGNGSAFIFAATLAEGSDLVYPVQAASAVVCDANGQEVISANGGDVLTVTAKDGGDFKFTGWKSVGLTLTEEQMNSKSFTFTMPENAVSLNAQYRERYALEIITQPVDVAADKGVDAVVSVAAKGDGLTYEWYYKNPGNVKFYKSGDQFVVGDGSVYSIPMEAWRDGQQVYCVVTDETGASVQSNTVTLSIDAGTIQIIEQPVSVEAESGKDAVVTVKATGEGLSYTWYYKNPGNVKFYVSGDQFVKDGGASYSIPMAGWRDGQQVYCVITDINGDAVQTNTVTLTMSK